MPQKAEDPPVISLVKTHDIIAYRVSHNSRGMKKNEMIPSTEIH